MIVFAGCLHRNVLRLLGVLLAGLLFVNCSPENVGNTPQEDKPAHSEKDVRSLHLIEVRSISTEQSSYEFYLDHWATGNAKATVSRDSHPDSQTLQRLLRASDTKEFRFAAPSERSKFGRFCSESVEAFAGEVVGAPFLTVDLSSLRVLGNYRRASIELNIHNVAQAQKSMPIVAIINTDNCDIEDLIALNMKTVSKVNLHYQGSSRHASGLYNSFPEVRFYETISRSVVTYKIAVDANGDTYLLYIKPLSNVYIQYYFDQNFGVKFLGLSFEDLILKAALGDLNNHLIGVYIRELNGAVAMGAMLKVNETFEGQLRSPHLVDTRWSFKSEGVDCLKTLCGRQSPATSTIEE